MPQDTTPADLRRDLALLEQEVGAYRPSDALLRVCGDDRLSWLQGQLTQDVSGLQPGEARYGLLLHPTGKIMADVDVLCRADDVVLVCAAEVLDEVRDYLERYIMMEDVELWPLPGTVLSLQGPGARGLRDALCEARGAGAVFPVDRLGRGGLLVLEGPDQAALPPEVLSAGGAWVSDASVELARVRAGRPRLGVDFGPTVLPQVAGLARRAVSFDKGCYRGQEPVVMLEHRGSPPKRLVCLELESDSTPPAGASLLDASGGTLGALTSAARAPDGPVYALGTLKRGAELCDVVAVDHGPPPAPPLPARALRFVE